MARLTRAVFAVLLVWLLIGCNRFLTPKPPTSSSETSGDVVESMETAPLDTVTAAETILDSIGNALAIATRNGPAYEISSVEYLETVKKNRFSLAEVNVSYYLIANSDRCQFNALAPCLQEQIKNSNINVRDFQYTYFLDRVVRTGSGILIWSGATYFVHYSDLLKSGWNEGTRNFKNDYNCTTFSYKSKQAIEFIQQNISNKSLFIPIDDAPFPNGPTASGQQAIDWLTLSVNTTQFPLSVPDSTRRARLKKNMIEANRIPPEQRVYVILEFPNGKKYLTEASDTSYGVKPDTVNWRIRNTPEDIRFFRSLGNKAKAACYVVDDADLSFDRVLVKSVK